MKHLALWLLVFLCFLACGVLFALTSDWQGITSVLMYPVEITRYWWVPLLFPLIPILFRKRNG